MSSPRGGGLGAPTVGGMTLQLPALESRAEVRWVTPAAGRWVGTRGGRDAGTVERLDGRYHARSVSGRALGSFPDLDAAFAAVEGGDDAGVRDGGWGSSRRAVRTLLWVINGAAAVAALILAVALLR